MRDFSIICGTRQHNILIYAIGVPIIVVWTIGFPLVIFFILKKNKDLLEKKEMVITYGTFYIGLKNNAFYWYFNE